MNKKEKKQCLRKWKRKQERTYLIKECLDTCKTILLIAALFALVFFIFFSLHGSKSEKEARRLYEEAQSHFKNEEYEQTITNVTKALELTNEGKASFTISYSFYNGNIHYLRAQAYEALGKIEDAIVDYNTATTRGTKFLSKSRPIPGAKAESFRTLSLFHNSLGIAYAKVDQFEDALAEFEKAIGAALGSVSGIGAYELLLASLLEGEIGKRQEFTKIIGAYCYNVYLMEQKLGRNSNAKEIAEQLDYDKTMVVMLK